MPEFLYIHIPFCARKCIYCDFLSIRFDERTSSDYADALCIELELKKGLAGELKTVFLGGGTPSILPEKDLGKIFKCIYDNYRIKPDAEITIEANPGTVTKEKASFIASLGINRCSIGVQSFVDSELRAIGRIHTADEAMQAVGMFRYAGIKNISVDLIYGVPGQTLNSWISSVRTAISLGPKHISAYELTPEKGTPLIHLLDAGKLSMPPEDDTLVMYDSAAAILPGSGYEHYEISNYAQPGYFCIHNLNYWNRGEYIGAGAGAHSFIGGVRSANTRDLPEYVRRLKEHLSPEEESTEISGEDSLKEFVFLGLRKTEGIRLSDAAELGLDLRNASPELTAEGFTETTNSRFRLTSKGMKISNTVVVRLLQDLGL